MPETTYYIVDVFAVDKYTGNQLTVFRHVDDMSGDELQRLAREFSFSETTFVTSEKKRDGGYDARIFTPAEELPFAGHPTLGTAFIIRNKIQTEPAETVVLNLKVGQIPVSFERDGMVWMRQMAPKFGPTFDPEPIADILSLDVQDIDDRFPVQDVSTGVPFIIVPLRTREALQRAMVVKDKFFAFIRNTSAKSVMIFCPEPHRKEHDMSVRVFADYYGVPEDPATGSANGCLGGYLVEHDYFKSDVVDVSVDQGYEIGRPSLILVRAEKRGSRIDILVGGRVVMVGTGQLV